MAILDADKEGAGRALFDPDHRPGARHVEGVALLYADNMTDSMAEAISETNAAGRFSRLTTRSTGAYGGG